MLICIWWKQQPASALNDAVTVVRVNQSSKVLGRAGKNLTSWTDQQIWETIICVVITTIDPIYTVTFWNCYIWILEMSDISTWLLLTNYLSTTETERCQSHRKTVIIRCLPLGPWWLGALARGWPWEWRKPCTPWRGRPQSARPASDSLLLAWQPYRGQRCWGGTVSCRGGDLIYLSVFMTFSYLRLWKDMTCLHVTIHHFAGVLRRIFKVLQVGLHLT